jgi:Mg2+ and Co2+ transporter CorA
MLSRISDVLDESAMGFLALIGLSLGLAPFLFELPHRVELGFNFAQWMIIGLFALEYAVNFSLSMDRRKFVLVPWHLLDAVIITSALISLLPAVSGIARTAPALRILRLFSILLFGPRVGYGFHRQAMPPPPASPDSQPLVTILRSGDSAPCKCEWDEMLRWAASPMGGWLHASNLSPERLKEIASAAGVSHVMIEAALHESSYPRIESGSRWTALTLSLPTTGKIIRRDPILLLVSANGMLSLSSHLLDLPYQTAQAQAIPWLPGCALQVIRLALARDEELAGRLERMVRQLEELPAVDSPESFFKQTFRLKRVLSTAKSDLWRLRGLLDMLADGRRQLPGLDPDQRESIAPLVEEADYLYETVENIREALLSVLELHIDIAAHDTNRFMRLLAIVSTLALIPAVVGGLLGMNLVEAPWPVTLGQVAFGTLVLTLGVLYTFMAKGWLGPRSVQKIENDNIFGVGLPNA